MAIVDKNIIIKGLKGKLGNMLVFRQRNGKTIVSTVPQKTDKPPTPAQLTRREKFRKAVVYAQGVLQNPTLHAWYAANLFHHQSVYHAALSDFMHPPQILAIDTQSYHGKQGDHVFITIPEESRATGVTLTFCHADGTLAEEGTARPGIQKNQWVYTAQHTQPSWHSFTLLVRSADKPGNTSELTTALEVTL